MAFTPRFTYWLYQSNGATLIGEVTRVFDSSVAVALNATGSGRLNIDPDAASDETVADLVATFREGRFIGVELDGTEIARWRIEAADSKYRTPDEELGEFLALSGRGAGCRLADALVYPYGGPGQVPAVDSRIFSFAATDYDDVAWGAAVEIDLQSTVNPYRAQFDAAGNLVAAPVGWPVPTAYWIWGTAHTQLAADGTCYFRSSFTLAGSTVVAFTATADNLYTVYLNGAPILGEAVVDGCWREHKRVEVTLPAGTYQLAAVAINNPNPADPTTNPAGLLFAAFTLDANGEPDAVLKVSDGSWLCLDYPANEPGFTPGAIIRILVDEAQARGHLSNLVLSFDDTNDSDGDPWPEVPWIAFPVGSTVLEAVEQLAREGWIDWRLRPDGITLDCWNPGGSSSPPVAVTMLSDGTANSNLVELEHGAGGRPVNRVLVRYPNGYLEVEDAASVAADGPNERYLTVDVATADEAARLGQLRLDELVLGDRSVVGRVEPAGSADVPLIGFDVRDSVTVPAPNGTPTSYRTLAVTVQEDAEGEPVFVVEWNVRPPLQQERSEALLRSLGSGILGNVEGSRPVSATALGSHTPAAVPVLPSLTVRAPKEEDFPSGPPSGGGGGPNDIVWSWPGVVAPAVDTLGNPWYPPAAVTLTELIVAVNVADAITDLVVDLLVDGVVEATATLPNGDTSVSVALTEAVTDLNVVQPRIDASVNGLAEDLSVIIRYE